MCKFGRHFLSDCSGATAIEYAIMGAAIAAVIAGVVGTLGVSTGGLFQKAADLF